MAKGKPMNIIEYPDREILAMDLADAIASDLENALLTHDRVSLAVPGGTSPGPVFDLLRAVHLAWDRVDVMLSDERWVPEDDAQSNTRLIRERLLQDNAAAASFVPFYRAGQSATEGAAAAAPTLATHMPLSVLVLGMGEDMHTASLFPGAEGVDAAMAADAPLLCPVFPEGQAPRVSLPAHALQGAMSKHLLIFGAAKREALEKATQLPQVQAPVGAVMTDLTVHWAA